MFTRAKPDAVIHPKRFWKTVAVGPEGEGGWPVTLDGRTPHSPAGRKLVAPTQALAELIAGEWEAQEEVMVLASMQATRLAFTAIDRVSQAREAVADEVAAYAASDLLCYFAEGPGELIRREQASWSPLLEWANAELGLVLERTSGIVHQPQPPATVERVRSLALELDDWRLSGLAWAAALFGSAVLALALERGRVDGEGAFTLSQVDDAFQVEQWGVDEEAAERVAVLRAEALLLGRWFAALG